MTPATRGRINKAAGPAIRPPPGQPGSCPKALPKITKMYVSPASFFALFFAAFGVLCRPNPV
jgi:hypothetical protein